jgi:hypothetical protein
MKIISIEVSKIKGEVLPPAFEPATLQEAKAVFSKVGIKGFRDLTEEEKDIGMKKYWQSKRQRPPGEVCPITTGGKDFLIFINYLPPKISYTLYQLDTKGFWRYTTSIYGNYTQISWFLTKIAKLPAFRPFRQRITEYYEGSTIRKGYLDTE